MDYLIFPIALLIILAIGLWPRLRRQRQYKKNTKEVDKVHKLRNTNLKRVK